MPSSRASAALLCVLALGTGCVIQYRPPPPPSDEALIRYFHDHRVDLDSLRANTEGRLRYDGPKAYDYKLERERQPLLRRTGLPGGGLMGASSRGTRIFFPAIHGDARSTRDWVDAKGFAWLDSTPVVTRRIASEESASPLKPPPIVDHVVSNLDSLDREVLRRPGTYIRHLEGNWWIYRWTGPRSSGD